MMYFLLFLLNFFSLLSFIPPRCCKYNINIKRLEIFTLTCKCFMHCDRKNRDNFNRPFIINEVLDELEISEDIY